jgi:hypothetical protein
MTALALWLLLLELIDAPSLRLPDEEWRIVLPVRVGVDTLRRCRLCVLLLLLLLPLLARVFFPVGHKLSLISKFRSLVEDAGRNLILPLLKLKDELPNESRDPLLALLSIMSYSLLGDCSILWILLILLVEGGGGLCKREQ